MEELYKKIMQKPKAYRIRLAYLITAFLGVILVIIWISLTLNNFRSFLDKESGTEESFPQISPSLREEYQQEMKELKEKQKELEEIGY